MTDENPEPLPELAADYKRLERIIRTNTKMDEQIFAKYNRQLDTETLILARVNDFIGHVLGSPQTSRERLDFELKHAESMRQILMDADKEAANIAFKERAEQMEQDAAARDELVAAAKARIDSRQQGEPDGRD